MKPYIIGVCGRSCSGKSTVVGELERSFDNVMRISQDLFFKRSGDDIKHWESPDCLRNDMLISSLKDLKGGKSTYIPSYGWTEIFDKKVYPKKYIIVEGHLLFVNDSLYSLFDNCIWVDVSDDNLITRRISRNRSCGKGKLDTYDYIKNVVLPESKKYELLQKSRSRQYIDGNKSIDEMVKEFRQFI